MCQYPDSNRLTALGLIELNPLLSVDREGDYSNSFDSCTPVKHYMCVFSTISSQTCEKCKKSLENKKKYVFKLHCITYIVLINSLSLTLIKLWADGKSSEKSAGLNWISVSVLKLKISLLEREPLSHLRNGFLI